MWFAMVGLQVKLQNLQENSLPIRWREASLCRIVLNFPKLSVTEPKAAEANFLSFLKYLHLMLYEIIPTVEYSTVYIE
jgi:hypothetical protein